MAGSDYFGSWLDDASVIEKDGVWFGLSMGYWRANLNRQVDAPVMSGAFGVGHGVQIGASVPVYHFLGADGAAATGIGTTWVYGKALLRDPDKSNRRIGVAVIPVLDIATGDVDPRMGWGVPVSLEVRGDGLRVYGSSGYFSRGAVFVAAAVERQMTDRSSVTATFTRSVSTRDTGTFTGSQSQFDLGISAAYTLSDTAGVFGTLGRTFAMSDADGFWFGAGMSIRLSRPTSQP